MKVSFNDLLSVKDAAKRLGLSTARVKQYVKDGRISPTIKIGETTVIPAEALVGIEVKPQGRPPKKKSS